MPVPGRCSRVDPWVISSDTEAEIACLEAVFGAKETPGSRMLGPDGRIGHVEVELGGSIVMLFDAQPDWAGESRPPTKGVSSSSTSLRVAGTSLLIEHTAESHR